MGPPPPSMVLRMVTEAMRTAINAISAQRAHTDPARARTTAPKGPPPWDPLHGTPPSWDPSPQQRSEALRAVVRPWLVMTCGVAGERTWMRACERSPHLRGEMWDGL
jgi:hypothetical protein